MDPQQVPPPCSTLPQVREAVRAALGRGDATALHTLDAQLAQWTSTLTTTSCDETLTAHLLKLRALVLLKLEAYELSCNALTLAANVLGRDAHLWGAMGIARSRLGDHAEAARAITLAYAMCARPDRAEDASELRARLDRMIHVGDLCVAAV